MARRPKTASAGLIFNDIPRRPPGPSWYEGRTFYACLCGAQRELTNAVDDHPDALDCWSCKAPASMCQWVPPSVKRDRALANSELL